jgi:ferrochelatase
VAFVSEHSETLVELDLEYRHRAEQRGVPKYLRVPTVAAHAAFIEELARIVRAASGFPPGACRTQSGERLCPVGFARCFAAP